MTLLIQNKQIYLLFQLPYKDTWIFDLLIILISISILYLFIKRQIKQSADSQKLLREKVREKTKEYLEQKEKAENSEKAKELFLANMSHEIRTPMNVIAQATRLLLEKNPKEDQLKYLHGIRENSDNLIIIINDILDLSKIQAGKISFESISFNLQELIQSVIEAINLNAREKKLEIISLIDENLHQNLVGDKYRLRQILLNLAGNAVKFTEKGTVKIHVEIISMIESEIILQFQIIDTGIGIAQDKLDYIFDMFTQESSSTTRKFGGSGLGLAICKTLIERQGGKIEVKSKQNVGSTFTFSLPFQLQDEIITAPKDFQNPERIKIEESKTTVDGLQILLVEDNPFNQMVAIDTLKSIMNNVHVDAAENGIVALNKVMKNQYDVILMDIQMPEMDGHEATKKIRSLTDFSKNSIPIIAMTASVIKSEIDKCYESGMDAFIGKPFKVEELIEKIVLLTKKKKDV